MSVTEHDQVTAREERRDDVFAPRLGPNGESCEECGTPLAHDQRYCLNCGRRRGAARLPFMDVIEARLRRGGEGLHEEVAHSTKRILPATSYAALPRSTLAGGAVALFAIVLGLGVLIGAVADDDSNPVAAAPPQVIRLSAPVPAPAASQTFTSDWPVGKEGFTVQLQRLPKGPSDPAQVQAAKQAATAKGAPAVGALDSNEFGSLEPDSYIVYSGVFATRGKARAALGRLRADFAGARVVEVSASGGGDPAALSGKKKEATVDRNQLQQLQKTSPGDYEKKSRKLPDTTKLPGKAPPKDEKQPGGGKGGGDVIE